MLICESCGFQQVMAQSLKSQKVEPVLSSMVADCLAGLSVIGTVTHTNTNKVMAHEYPYIYIYIYILGMARYTYRYRSVPNSKWK